MMNLKEAIIGYVAVSDVLSWSMLMSMLDTSFPTVVQENKLQAISELVQSNQIKRIEVMNMKQNRHDMFYMSVDFRLM